MKIIKFFNYFTNKHYILTSIYLLYNDTNMTKVGTFGGEMDKIGTFSVTKCWALYDWSLYRARVLRAHAGP